MFADALTGGDMKKLEAGMKSGQFKSHDLLKVAAHMKDLVDPKQLETMMKNPEKQVIRMKNAWGSLIMAMNQSGLWNVISDGIDQVTKSIVELTPKIKDIAGVIKNLFSFVWNNKEVLLTLAIGWRTLSKATALFVSARTAGNIVSMASSFRLLGISMVTAFMAPLAAITAVMLALDTYEAYTQHKKGLVADFRNPNLAGNAAATEEYNKSLETEKTTPTAMSHFKANRAASKLLQSFPDSASIEEKGRIAEEIRKNAGSNFGGLDLASLHRIEQQYLAVRRENTMQLGGLSSNAPVINITVQNTEPNVTKDWLSSVLPSVLGGALQQHVQKESAYTPNMLLR